jgi:hypothetical protein
MYQLTNKHYDNLPYFLPELRKDNIYNLDGDPLIDNFSREFVKYRY